MQQEWAQVDQRRCCTHQLHRPCVLGACTGGAATVSPRVHDAPRGPHVQAAGTHP